MSAASLAEKVRKWHPDTDIAQITRAYDYAEKMHAPQKRANGEPYFIHPVAVAEIVADLKLDAPAVITALLHDTVEDTEATLESIEAQFGKKIAQLVDGVTKLTRIEMQGENAKQAENFRKLVLAMSDDIRVLLVKLSDRLHNMRTLAFIEKPEKRKRIARETLEIYVPLAERIGMHAVKDELEDIAFRELLPEEYSSIITRLNFLRAEGNDMVQSIIVELQKCLNDHQVPCKIDGREKKPYSIWRKMAQKKIAFEQLSDIMAFRIYVDNIGQCYQALGAIHGKYHGVPGRFKDYISTPKPNGYKSIHSTVMGPLQQRIEVQIRTHEMHEINELGVAAHWAYKQGDVQGDRQESKADGRQFRWLRELVEILEQENRADDLLQNSQMELYQDQVFCFTPKGEIVALPRTSTPVDFAYAVHSQVGDTCVGARVNGRLVPLNSELHNGDQVEIQTSKNQTPSPAWERFVVTGKARARIRRFIRLRQRAEYSSLGKAMLQKVFRQEGYEFSEKAVMGVLGKFKLDHVEDLYATVGQGTYGSRDVFNAIFPGHRNPQTETKTPDVIQPPEMPKARLRQKGNDRPVPIKGLIPGVAVHFARCCHPLPGDRIVGIITTGKGVTIHTIDCETLEIFANVPERWLDVAWEDGTTPEKEQLVGRLEISIANEAGALGTLSTVIGKNGGNISNLRINSRSVDFWDMMIDVQVKDLKQLTNIVAALRATPSINTVERARGR